MGDRRRFLAALAGFAASAGTLRGVGAAAQGTTRIVLLGTKGGPTVGNSGRSNPATVVLIHDVPYLVDCGYGVARQMIAAGVALERLRHVFITHHHSDHTLEYGPLLYNAWVSPKPPTIDVYGPPGVQDLTRAFFEYQKLDIDTRIADEGMTDLRKLVRVHEFDAAGVVFQNDDVTVTSQRVSHPPITQSYAYRFEARDRSVVISGDTAYGAEVARFAKGADVLVHEAMYLPAIEALVKRAPNASRLREHLMASHTATEDVGRVAAQAGVKTLVLSHLVPGSDPSITDEQWAEGARKHFKGRIVVGKDLMEI